MRRPHVPASRQSDAQSAQVAQARLADRQAACGHARYTKGCDLCALAGIYHDHMSRPDLTAAERSKVSRLYLAGDKAALFKLWQALPAADDS
jgi:hypothetical protein